MMKRFMIPKDAEEQEKQNKMSTDYAYFMQELETMRIQIKSYFPPKIEIEKIWGKAMDEKYSSFG